MVSSLSAIHVNRPLAIFCTAACRLFFSLNRSPESDPCGTNSTKNSSAFLRRGNIEYALSIRFPHARLQGRVLSSAEFRTSRRGRSERSTIVSTERSPPLRIRLDSAFWGGEPSIFSPWASNSFTSQTITGGAHSSPPPGLHSVQPIPNS